MKKIFSIFAMAAVVLASCVKEQAPVLGGDNNEIVPSGELVEKVFTVGDIESKTYIDGTVANNKIVIKWCADDAISVWDGVANRKFTMVGEPNGASATFKGLVDANSTDFYAIYPYDENLQYSYDEANQRMVFTVNKPAVQYANPEGGLADDSAYACGKADVDGKISFVNRSTLLKFSLADGMNVKSLKLSGNEDDDILAGTLDIRYKDNNFSVGWKSAGKSTELTFCNEDGSNLKTGVDYYISMIGNTFGKGYSVTLTFDDGTSVTRDSDKSVQYMSNQIYSLASQPLSMSMFEAGEEGGEDTGDPLTSYYAAYTAGQDITIAGRVINKATYGNGTLIKANETFDVNAKGVFFVENGATVNLCVTSSQTHVFVIGDNPSVRSLINHKNKFSVGNNGVAGFLNLDMDSSNLPTTNNQDLFGVNSSNYVIELWIDNCKLTYPTNGRQFFYNATTTLKDFAFHNNDFVISKTGAHAYMFKFDSGANTHNLDMQNNVIWHSNESGLGTSYGFHIIQGTSSKLNSLIFKNNTIVNMKTQSNAGSYINITNATDGTVTADVQKNIFYDTTITNNKYLLRSGVQSGTCVDNLSYCNDKWQRNFAGGLAGATEFTVLDASPFASMDFTNGVFVPVDSYKSYGAQR